MRWRTALRSWMLRSDAGIGFLVLLLATGVLVIGCGQEPTKPAVQLETKPAGPKVPDEIQAAADALLGSETQVLLFGDRVETGREQFLAANPVTKMLSNDAPGTIVRRAVVAEKIDGRWTELLRGDEYLKNSHGFLALTPVVPVNGWRLQYRQDPEKGLQMYFTPLRSTGDIRVPPIAVRWNPKTKRYQSLDRTYEHFLNESSSLEVTRSTLR
jgi:hypothetical protein